MIELGEKVKDILTGYEGIVTSQAKYLSSSDRYCVTRLSFDGNIQDEWIDVSRLIKVDADKEDKI